ncbi:hypothetical protein [Kitasatospora sp. NPDC057015]|uniref:hypothetical protein n=1 Tax=Kitasatospora sp. NPDC057015 TaxID=3346001 RepID=UPI003643F286
MDKPLSLTGGSEGRDGSGFGGYGGYDGRSEGPVRSGYGGFAGPVLSLRPLRLTRFDRGWALQVPAGELAGLAAGPAAAQRLGARRGFLSESAHNRELAELLRLRPEEFGRVGLLALGTEGIRIQGGVVELIRPESIDGFQRLTLLARAAAERGRPHLDRSTVRLEVFTSPEREHVRRLHDIADLYLNPATAQDCLRRCPELRRLAEEFESEGWLPRFSMADVTRALACLSTAPTPYLSQLVSTDRGLDVLWADIASPHYGALIHPGVHPLGVLRALEARRTAREALARIPKAARTGPARLLDDAPDLICWAACRHLPLHQLHDERSTTKWDRLIDQELPAWTVSAAHDYIGRYRRAEPAHSPGSADRTGLALWLQLAGAGPGPVR